MTKKNIAIFASGEGTNAKAILESFKDSEIEVVLIVSDNSSSRVTEMALDNSIDFVLIDKEKLSSEKYMIDLLDEYNLDLIVLAGFMKIIPEYLVKHFKDKILNIHPSVDPKYDGRTGKAIHREVLNNKDRLHGSRVHVVSEEGVDKGEVIDSEIVEVNSAWSEEELEKVIKGIEHRLYPKAIRTFLNR